MSLLARNSAPMSHLQLQSLQIAFGCTFETFLAIAWPFVCVPVFVHLSIDGVSIWQKSLILFKYASVRNILLISDMPKALVIAQHEQCICHHFQCFS